MGLAEHLASKGSNVAVGDVIADLVKNQTANSDAHSSDTGPRLLSADDVAQAMALIASSVDNKDGWSPENFAKGVRQFCPSMSWDDVIYKLSKSNLNVRDEAGALFIVNTYIAATAGQHKAFPCAFMYEIWPNPQAQVSFLRFALHSSAMAPHLLDKQMATISAEPLETLYMVYHTEFSRMVNSPWNSLSLILALSHLLDSTAGDDARALLDHGIATEPLLVTLALARLKVQHPRLQSLLQQNVMLFLKRELSNSRLFFELFRICEKKVMLAFFCNLQRKDQSFIRFILDTLLYLGIFNELVLAPKREDIMMLDFIIELAVFASRRGYIQFESWFTNLLEELGNDMLHVSLEILHGKIQLEAARQRSEDSGVTAYLSSELTTIFKALGLMPMSPNNTANLKALYMQFTELAGELDRAENMHGNDDARIEKEAENLFLRLYRGEQSVDRMVDVLGDLRDSFQLYMRKVYAHVVQYPLEEFAFFNNYPAKELRITGQLVGGLIQRHMLGPVSESAMLDMLVRALQSAPDSNPFKFGMAALEGFPERIEQLPIFCTGIYVIPTIRQNTTSPVIRLIHSIVSSSVPHPGAAGESGTGTGSRPGSVPDRSASVVNQSRRSLDGGSATPGTQLFRSVQPSAMPDIGEPFVEPREDAKDKIQFAVNNLSQSNLEEKTKEVAKVLQPKHYAWFSQDIIVKRASQEPNYHSLYQQFVDALESPLLNKCILRETLSSVALLLNAESTTSSSRDRGYLKNLGAWLGGITLARNQPILRENVSFKDLLCEGFEGGRLLVAIPFVCKVLEQAGRSTIFHSPNPWLMSIMGVLAELYVTANLKLNLTFEIEVLCKALNLDVKEIVPTTLLSSKARGAVDSLTMDMAQVSIGGNGGRMSVGAGTPGPYGPSNSVIQMPTLTGNDINVDILGVLAQHALFQAADALFTQQPTMKKVFYMLMERMIREIIPIHVARSIYVAVSCTRDTIQKDFCGEPNEEHVHRAAQVMARGLAGALAVSLCREQLKNKLYLTMREFLIGHSIPEQTANNIAVGLVADNLDLACAIAEKESIERASIQIDTLLSDAYIARKRTRERTGQPYYDIARYGRLVYPQDFPDVLKVRLNGLQPGHLRVYEEFTQIPHFFSQIHNAVPGVAAAPMASALSQVADEAALVSPDVGDSGGDSGPKMAVQQCFDQFAAKLAELDKLMSTATPNITLSSLPSDHEVCMLARDILLLQHRSVSLEDTSMDFAHALVNYLYRSETQLGISLYVLLLARVCEQSARVAKEVMNWLAYADDDRKDNVPVALALINERLLSTADEDARLARHVEGGFLQAIDYAVKFMRCAVVEGAIPATAQTFPKAIQALVTLAQSGRAPQAVTQLLEDIQASQQANRTPRHSQDAGSQVLPEARQQAQQQQPTQLQAQQSGPAETAPAIPVTSAANAVPAAPIIPVSARSQETASYQQILFNWTRVCEHPAASETELTTLVQQLSQQVPLHDHGVSAAFFCANIESVVDFYDRSIAAARAGAGAGAGARAGGSTSGIGYQVADALAKLVVYLIKLGPKDSDGKADIDILRMFLSSIVLVIVQMHTTQPDVFSAHQRPLFRIMASLLHELNVCRRAGEPWCGSDRTREMAQAIGDSLALLNPSFVPGFSFSWLMLVSHRHFFPLLMQEKGLWPLASQLLAELIGFLQPFIVANQVVDSLKLLYRGMVCVILVVLHDYPEFLAEYALSLCNGIPTNCVQLRNLLLSAYPREMRLPEPLAPNLKIDLLPDVSRSPPIPFEYVSDLEKAELKDELVSYLKGEAPATAIKTMASRLFAKTSATEQQAVPSESCYSVKLINAFVLHAVVTITAMEDSAARETSQRMALDMIRQMLGEADAEASYLLVNAVANQLRFPSSHTYLCSRIVLALFSKSDERVREHIARALVERILVNRPFPWGLLVTLIELLRNPYYSFWDRPFTKRSPQITEILQAVAKSIHPIGTPTQHQAHGAEAANAANSAAQVAISQPPSHA